MIYTKRDNMRNKYIVILIGLFLLQFFFVSPIGEFALNDDWVQADTVRHLTEAGEWRVMPYAGATFHALVGYGSFFTSMFGFSFTVLRISTLILMLTTIVVSFLLFEKITKNKKLSFVGTLLLWLNPIVYNLSFTFMTDVPALFLLIAGMYLYLIGFERKKSVLVFLASSLCVIGFYTRQTNILLLVAGLVFSCYKKRLSYKEILLTFGIPLIIGAGIYFGLSAKDLLPQTTDSHIIKGFWRQIGHMKWWSFYIPMYLGMFLSPLTFGWLVKQKDVLKDSRLLVIVFVSTLFALIIRQAFHLQMPYVSNMIDIYGLAPMSGVLRGLFIPIFSSKLWGVITLLSAGSVGIGVEMLLQKKDRFNYWFIYLFGVLYTLALLAFDSFDRYIIMLIPVLIIALIKSIGKDFSYSVSAIILCVFAIYGISQTQFYMNWNNTRWKLADEVLIEMKLEPKNIDAGYEWNGWHDYWRASKEGPEPIPNNNPWWILGLFTDNTEDIVVSQSAMEGYSVIKEEKVRGWNPNNILFVLQKS